MDLADVAAREKSIAGTAERMARELATSRASSATAAADLKEMRTQVNTMQKAIKGKDRQLTELKETLKENGEVGIAGAGGLRSHCCGCMTRGRADHVAMQLITHVHHVCAGWPRFGWPQRKGGPRSASYVYRACSCKSLAQQQL